jgi:hypothetical protein
MPLYRIRYGSATEERELPDDAAALARAAHLHDTQAAALHSPVNVERCERGEWCHVRG